MMMGRLRTATVLGLATGAIGVVLSLGTRHLVP